MDLYTTGYSISQIALFDWTLDFWPHCSSAELSIKSKSHCDWRLISQEVTTRYLLLSDRYGLVFVGSPLWREDGSVICICCWPLPVFLGPEYLGNRDHILLSQIWDFPLRRLLPLAGSRWRYSTPPPQGWQLSVIVRYSLYSLGSVHTENTSTL
jgi:hypothetical protein